MVIPIFIICLSALVAGEAIALMLGMALSGSEKRSWLLNRNLLWLITDLVAGAGLCWLVWDFHEHYTLIWILVSILSLSHAWRFMEVLLAWPGAFCFNTALYIVNNLKLVGLLLTAIYLIWYAQQKTTLAPELLV